MFTEKISVKIHTVNFVIIVRAVRLSVNLCLWQYKERIKGGIARVLVFIACGLGAQLGGAEHELAVDAAGEGDVAGWRAARARPRERRRRRLRLLLLLHRDLLYCTLE